MVTDIQYTNSGISYLLSMDSKAMTEGVTCFPNIFFVTAVALNYINKVFSVHDIVVFYLKRFTAFKQKFVVCHSVITHPTIRSIAFCYFW